MSMNKEIKNKIFCGNSKEVLRDFPSNSVDLVVTSPPYYNLRNYQHKDQIGSEQTPKQYITNLINIFRECKRVLKNTGAIWVNIADSYSDINKSLIGIPERFVIAMQDELGLIRRNTIIWYKRSCMPSSSIDRFTIDFEYFYFFVKSSDTLLWKHYNTNEWTSIKPIVNFNDPTKENIEWEWYESPITKKKYKRSLWKSYDYFFETQYEPYSESTLLEIQKAYKGKGTKDYKGNGVQDPSEIKRRMIEAYNSKQIPFGGTKYPTNQDSVTNNTYSGNPYKIRINHTRSENSKSLQEAERGLNNNTLHKQNYYELDLEGRIKRCVWDITTANSKDHHFATYPEELIDTPIKACTRKGDLVLDPFLGSGTTAIKSQKLGRNYVGIELNPKYVSIAKSRLNNMISSYISRE